MFQNLRANNQLFILHKEAKHYVEIGSVVSVSAPFFIFHLSPVPTALHCRVRWHRVSLPNFWKDIRYQGLQDWLCTRGIHFFQVSYIPLFVRFNKFDIVEFTKLLECSFL